MTSISSPLFSANQSSFSLSNGFASTVFWHLSQTACIGFMYVTVRSPLKQRKRNVTRADRREAQLIFFLRSNYELIESIVSVESKAHERMNDPPVRPSSTLTII